MIAKSKRERDLIKANEIAKRLIPTIKSFMADDRMSLQDCRKQLCANDILEGFKLEKTKQFLRKVFKKDGIAENGWTLQYKHIMGSKIKEWLVLSKTKKSPY